MYEVEITDFNGLHLSLYEKEEKLRRVNRRAINKII